MKRFLLLTATALSMLLTTPQDTFFTSAQAAPALRRVITLTQPDGSTIQALPMGDEHMSYWVEAQTGHLLTQDATTRVWRRMSDAEVQENDVRWQKSRREAAKLFGTIRRIGGVKPLNQVKLPVVLVEFADVKLTNEFGTIAYTDAMLNDLNYDHVAYTYGGQEYHAGSIRKYWNIQSLGQFDPQFDVLGKVTLSQNRNVYGKDSNSSSIDSNISTFYKEVVDSVNQQGLLDQASLYDHNGDGVLDCLYIIYAGYGQNELSTESGLIWAKNHSGNIYTLNDGTKTNLFLLSPELFGRGKNELHPNIGVFTHEFGHSIGLPDFYGTSKSTQGQCFGMDSWSLMDQGEYNGRGQIPGCLTAHERMHLGWLEPTEIEPNSLDTLGIFVSTGDARIFRNPENADEYITIENHQPENAWEITWGNSMYYSNHKHEGLLITYVNFDQAIWKANSPNNDPSFQRCSPISADGDRCLYNDSEITTQEAYDAWRANLSSDIFPGASNIRKLNSNNPLFCWHNGDTIPFNINNIEQLADRRIVITFGEPQTTSIKPMSDTANNGRAIKRLQNGQIFIEKDGAYYDLLGRKVNPLKR